MGQSQPFCSKPSRTEQEEGEKIVLYADALVGHVATLGCHRCEIDVAAEIESSGKKSNWKVVVERVM